MERLKSTLALPLLISVQCPASRLMTFGQWLRTQSGPASSAQIDIGDMSVFDIMAVMDGAAACDFEDVSRWELVDDSASNPGPSTLFPGLPSADVGAASAVLGE